MDLAKEFGKRLKEIRKSKGLTQNQLAELANLETMSISRIETGARFPQKENIEKFARILKCEVKDLFNFKPNKSKPDLIKEITQKLKKAKTKDLMYFNEIIDSYMD